MNMLHLRWILYKIADSRCGGKSLVTFMENYYFAVKLNFLWRFLGRRKAFGASLGKTLAGKAFYVNERMFKEEARKNFIPCDSQLQLYKAWRVDAPIKYNFCNQKTFQNLINHNSIHTLEISAKHPNSCLKAPQFKRSIHLHHIPPAAP